MYMITNVGAKEVCGFKNCFFLFIFLYPPLPKKKGKKNLHTKQIFTAVHSKSLLLYDLTKMGLTVKETPIAPGMIVDTIWRLTFELYNVPK